MRKTAAILAGTVIVSAMASPALAPAGTVIPLSRRTSFTGAEGVFDKDRAIAATIATLNKHYHNLANFEKNTGTSVEVRAPAILPADVEERLNKRQSEALKDDQDREWTGTISVGTPKKNFVADFDTGSADTWIPSSSCNSIACSVKTKYNPASSSTSSKKPGTLFIQYADGSSISGPVYTDTVTIGGVTATNQVFSAVTTLSQDFLFESIDGLVGLALPPIAGLPSSLGTPFFLTAQAQHTVPVGQFAFYLAATGSELYLGGTDTKKYTGAIEFTGINTTTGFWQAMGGQAKVGGSVVLSGLQTIVDSGTTLMYCQPAATKAIYAKVPGSKVFDAKNGYYSYPCATPPQLSFNYGGKDWTVSAANFNLGTTTLRSKDCVGALLSLDMPFGPNTCLLGDVFMRNVYTVFDVDREAVGFASLA
ncbi:acid protease [Mycena filopes]|nr:acid protease [Mycena filopes]